MPCRESCTARAVSSSRVDQRRMLLLFGDAGDAPAECDEDRFEIEQCAGHEAGGTIAERGERFLVKTRLKTSGDAREGDDVGQELLGRAVTLRIALLERAR